LDAARFDHITQLFAQRRLSRRRAVTTAAAGVAATVIGAQHAGLAQDATPQASPVAAPESGASEKITYLFVQSFQSGSLTPNEADDRHTLTLEQGLGQTIYFADRPSRDVGVTPTAQFLEGLGFSEDNPPNAALIVETSDGETDLAVLELFAPTYDATTHTATYQVRGLEAWEENLEFGLQQGPTDLSAITPDFTGAHLLIDDCANAKVDCYTAGNEPGIYINSFDNVTFCLTGGFCQPCLPFNGHTQPDPCATFTIWEEQCEQQFDDCKGNGCYPDYPGAQALGCQ
jgi:hypothetical protein